MPIIYNNTHYLLEYPTAQYKQVLLLLAHFHVKLYHVQTYFTLSNDEKL